MKLLLCLLMVTSSCALAQEVKDFSLVNTKDGKTISLSSYQSAPAVVVIFTSHECPFDNYYKERVKSLVTSYPTIPFLFINSNPEPQESTDQMAIHYKDINAPYLADKDQIAMEIFGARKSPEAFLLATAGGKFTVVYSGAIDDNPQVASDVKQAYLKAALDNVMAGQKIEPATQRATGCTIRRK